MKLLNKKAMTLFELLAVIVILGIIALIAFPTVNTLIENTRKDAVAESANLFISNAVTNAETDYVAMEYTGEKEYFVYVGTVEEGRITLPEEYDTDFIIDLSEDFDSDVTAFIYITVENGKVTGYGPDEENFSYVEGDYTITEDIVLDTKESVNRKDVQKA